MASLLCCHLCDQNKLFFFFFFTFFYWADLDLSWDAFLHISVNKKKKKNGRSIIVADVNIILKESVPKARLCYLQSKIK